MTAREYDVDIRFTVRPLVDGVEVVATYPDGSYDRGIGRGLGSAFDTLAPKLANALDDVR